MKYLGICTVKELHISIQLKKIAICGIPLSGDLENGI